MNESSRTHARAYWPPAEGDEAVLPAAESAHLVRVLRVRPGAMIEWFDGRGGEGTAEVLASDRDGLRVRRVDRRPPAPPPTPEVTLLAAVLREGAMDVLLQKAVELGVSVLAPVLTGRGVVRLDPRQAAARRERWEAIVLNAARQCRAAWRPRVETPRPLPAVLAERPAFDVFLAGLLDGETVPLRKALAGPPPRTVGVVVGPEGDFSPDEQAALRRAGALAVRLGPRVLRAETASLYLLSALQFAWGAEEAAGRVP